MNVNDLAVGFAPEFMNATQPEQELPRDQQEITMIAGGSPNVAIRSNESESGIQAPAADEEGPRRLPALPWTERYAANDTGNAEHYVDRWGATTRYVPSWDKWMILENGWKLDVSGRAVHRGMELSNELLRGAIEIRNEAIRTETNKRALTMGYASRLKSMVELASKDPRIVVEVDELDADPLLVAAQNGVINLHTGQFRSFSAQDYMLKRLGTPYVEGAEAPRWRRFLREILNSDDEGHDADGSLVRYVQAAAGYSLTGLTSEQVFFFLHGSGRNGKSTLIETFHKVLGNYGRSTSPDVVAHTKYGPPDHAMADLHGVRLATLPETEAGQRIAESRLKAIVGGDKITASRKYENSFDFNPVLKLWIHGNHEPRIDGVDLGMWRRVKMIPFTRTIDATRVDRNLGNILTEELPGILNWMVEGCLRWIRDGRLEEPAVVTDATARYRRDQDIMGQFFEEKIQDTPDGEISQADLYQAYRDWAIEQNLKFEHTKIRFRNIVRKRPNCAEENSGDVPLWRGISFRRRGLA